MISLFAFAVCHRSRSTMSSSGCKKSIAMPAKMWTSFSSETRVIWLQRRLLITLQPRYVQF